MRLRSSLVLFLTFLFVVTLWPETTHAQRSVRRPAVRGPSARVVGPYRAPVYRTYRPPISFGYYHYYSPFYYGYYGYYSPFYAYWGYPWSYPGAYGGGFYGARSSVRLQVTPREAEVFVDGYLAGRVDDFDGVFQRLRLPPGEHEVVLYLDGYRSVRQRVYLTADSTFRIRYTMEPLQPGETIGPRPLPPPPSPPQAPAVQDTGRAGPPAPQSSVQVSAFGQLSIRVQPQDADVLIDGEVWQGSDLENRLLVEVTEGTHRVEIRRDGYETFSRDVLVRGGETVTMNVSLSRREP